MANEYTHSAKNIDRSAKAATWRRPKLMIALAKGPLVAETPQ